MLRGCVQDGMTPLAYATMRDNLTAVNVLLRAGVSMEIRRVSRALEASYLCD